MRALTAVEGSGFQFVEGSRWMSIYEETSYMVGVVGRDLGRAALLPCPCSRRDLLHGTGLAWGRDSRLRGLAGVSFFHPACWLGR
jgi:hypothetical protein